MSLDETQALVLRSDALGEADKIVTFYSPDLGKIKAAANGARRPRSRFGSSLEGFAQVKLVFYGKPSKGLYRLSQTELLDYFSSLREDLSRMAAACYVVDFVCSLTVEEDSNPPLFWLTLHMLQLLNAGQDPFVLLRIFEIRALSLLGYAPQLNKCVFCEKELDLNQKIVYNRYKGGLCCPSCGKKRGDNWGESAANISLSGGSIGFLKQAARVDLSKISRIKLSGYQIQEVKELLHQHQLFHLKQEINSYRFLEQLC